MNHASNHILFNGPTMANTPPCSRYNGGESDQRLISVWDHVAGLMGGSSRADALSNKIARFYDYKGLLVVATRSKLDQQQEAFIRKSWVDVGHEFKDHVEFVDVHSDRWKTLWKYRRFESDWRP